MIHTTWQRTLVHGSYFTWCHKCSFPSSIRILLCMISSLKIPDLSLNLTCSWNKFQMFLSCYSLGRIFYKFMMTCIMYIFLFVVIFFCRWKRGINLWVCWLVSHKFKWGHLIFNSFSLYGSLRYYKLYFQKDSSAMRCTDWQLHITYTWSFH